MTTYEQEARQLDREPVYEIIQHELSGLLLHQQVFNGRVFMSTFSDKWFWIRLFA